MTDLNCANGQSCTFGPHGPHRSIQCQYCGALPVDLRIEAVQVILRLEDSAVPLDRDQIIRRLQHATKFATDEGTES